MSEVPQGPGWWRASDNRWYPPEAVPGSAPGPTPATPATPPGLPGTPDPWGHPGPLPGVGVPGSPAGLAPGLGPVPGLEPGPGPGLPPGASLPYGPAAWARPAGRSTVPFLVAAVGGLAVVVGALGPWYSLSISLGTVSHTLLEVGAFSGWTDIAPVLAIVVAALTLALPLVRPTAGWPQHMGWLVRLAALGALAVVLVSVFVRPLSGEASALAIGHTALRLDWGIWVSLVGATVMAAGAFLAGSER